jgi:hypothetical protein
LNRSEAAGQDMVPLPSENAVTGTSFKIGYQQARMTDARACASSRRANRAHWEFVEYPISVDALGRRANYSRS